MGHQQTLDAQLGPLAAKEYTGRCNQNSGRARTKAREGCFLLVCHQLATRHTQGTKKPLVFLVARSEAGHRSREAVDIGGVSQVSRQVLQRRLAGHDGLHEEACSTQGGAQKKGPCVEECS